MSLAITANFKMIDQIGSHRSTVTCLGCDGLLWCRMYKNSVKSKAALPLPRLVLGILARTFHCPTCSWRNPGSPGKSTRTHTRNPGSPTRTLPGLRPGIIPGILAVPPGLIPGLRPGILAVPPGLIPGLIPGILAVPPGLRPGLRPGILTVLSGLCHCYIPFQHIQRIQRHLITSDTSDTSQHIQLFVPYLFPALLYDLSIILIDYSRDHYGLLFPHGHYPSLSLFSRSIYSR